jgi:hypothetical protein
MHGTSGCIGSSATKFTFLKLLSASSTITLHIDEFRVGGTGGLSETQVRVVEDYLRRLYDHDVDSRGRADQSTVDYPLTTPVKLLGETPVLDYKHAGPHAADNRSERQRYQGLSGRSRACQWIIQHEDRLHQIAGWTIMRCPQSQSGVFINTLNKIDEALTTSGEMESDRQRKGWSAVIAALKWFNDLLAQEGTPSIFGVMPSDYLGQMIQRLKASREGTSPADHFIRFLESVVAADDRVEYEKIAASHAKTHYLRFNTISPQSCTYP